jgi:hypothetical protein
MAHLSDKASDVKKAGRLARLYHVCVHCLNEHKGQVMKYDNRMPCLCCFLTCPRGRSKKVGQSRFCGQCNAALLLHEEDRDNKKVFFAERLMGAVVLKYPSWVFSFNPEWRTIAQYKDRRREKRVDVEFTVRNVHGRHKVMVVLEFVLSSDITEVSMADKRQALARYAQRNRDAKIVFVVAYQTWKASKNSDVALAEMVVLRQWLTAVLMEAESLPDGDTITMITLGATATQRLQPTIRESKHLDLFDRPQHATHEWPYSVHWNENEGVDDALKNRPEGAERWAMVSTTFFGREGLVKLPPVTTGAV